MSVMSANPELQKKGTLSKSAAHKPKPQGLSVNQRQPCQPILMTAITVI